MIEKLIKNTNLEAGTQFSNTALSFEDQMSLKNYIDFMPLDVSAKQMAYLRSNDEEVELYHNPLKDLILDCGKLVTNVKYNVGLYVTPNDINDKIKNYSPDIKFINLIDICDNASDNITDFYHHTNRLSGVERSDTEKPNLDTEKPNLDTALSIGRELMPYVHKSSHKVVNYKDQYYIGNPSDSYDDIIEQNLQMFIETTSGEVIDMTDNPDVIKGYVTDINDPDNTFKTEDDLTVSNLPMLGSFGSLYVNDDGKINLLRDHISDNLNNLLVITQADRTEIMNSKAGVVMSTLNTITSNTSLHNTIIYLSEDIKKLSNTLEFQVTSDHTFFNNSKKLLKKINAVKKLTNMSSSHEILYDKIGTSDGKMLRNKLK